MFVEQTSSASRPIHLDSIDYIVPMLTFSASVLESVRSLEHGSGWIALYWDFRALNEGAHLENAELVVG